MFKVISGSSEVCVNECVKHFIGFNLQPISFDISINVDNEQYFESHFVAKNNSGKAEIMVRVNFHNLKVINKTLSDLKYPEGIIGYACCFPKKSNDPIKIFYEIYLEDEAFKAIERMSLVRLPSSISVSLQNEDGTFFNDDWVKDSTGRYPKIYISEFSCTHDLK
jgi:hypothetical protein